MTDIPSARFKKLVDEVEIIIPSAYSERLMLEMTGR